MRHISRSPEPNLTGEITRQLYELDVSSPAAHKALECLPVPLRHLSPQALRTVLSCVPLTACSALPEPLEFLGFESRLKTGLHAPSDDAKSACARRYNSLHLSAGESELSRSSMMSLARYLPLLPPVTSFILPHHKRTLAVPQARRWPRCKDSTVPPSVQKARDEWLETYNFTHSISQFLTHLSFENSSIARNVLCDICITCKTLKSLNLCNMVLTGPKTMHYTTDERCEDINRCIKRLPHLRYLSLALIQCYQPAALKLSHMNSAV